MVTRNRRDEYTLDEVLGAFITLSGAGHPHDHIDGKTAKIEVRRPRTGENAGRLIVVISWSGYPTDDEEYGR